MKLTLLIYLLLTLLTTQSIFAQTTIRGTINGSDKQPIPGLSVTVNDMSLKHILAFTFTNNKGQYALDFRSKQDSVILHISGMTIHPITYRIKNKKAVRNVQVTIKDMKLREVDVKSNKMWINGDTVNFNVSAYMNKKDLVIGDILKKLPGITVDKNGQISWHGKPINTFYIENLNMLRSRYNIATNNVAAEDVATVQVLQNHQPVKALDSISPGQTAAINLKLKKTAKNKLSYMLKTGVGGVPVLWENELAAMIFAPRFQNISTYATNNTGNDLSSQNQSFNLAVRYDPESLTHVNRPMGPGLSYERYLFNNTHEFTVNNLLKTDSITTYTMNVSYRYNKDTRRGSAVTTYALPGNNQLVVNEVNTSHSILNELYAGLQYKRNAEKNYFENSLDLSGRWEDANGEILNGQDLRQHKTQSGLSFYNHLQKVHKITTDKGYSIKSDIGFKSSPEQLSVIPGVFPEFLNQNQPYDALKQDARVTKLNFSNQFQLMSAIKLPHTNISPSLELNAQYRNIKSQMFIMNQDDVKELTSDSLHNNQDIFQSSALLRINGQYLTKKRIFMLDLPVEYRSIFLYDRINNQREPINRILFNPQLSFNYRPNELWSYNADYSFANNLGDLLSFYTGYIMSGYRNLSRNNGQISESNGHRISLSVLFANNPKRYNIRLRTAFGQTTSNMVSGQNLLGPLVVNTVIHYKSKNTMAGIALDGTKVFDWKQLQFNFTGMLSVMGSQVYQSAELTPFRNLRGYTLASVYLTPFDFMTLSYGNTWDFNKYIQNAGTRPYQSIDDYFSVKCNLPCNFEFSAKAYHYYKSANTYDKNLFFIDMGLKWVINKLHFSLGCNNILNIRNCINGYLDAINSYQYSYYIRPRNVLLKMELHIK